jgi:hypothetical protein
MRLLVKNQVLSRQAVEARIKKNTVCANYVLFRKSFHAEIYIG